MHQQGPGLSCAHRMCRLALETSGQHAALRPGRRVFGHAHSKPRAVTLAEIAAENDFKNDMVLWVLPRQLRDVMPRIVASWVSASRSCSDSGQR